MASYPEAVYGTYDASKDNAWDRFRRPLANALIGTGRSGAILLGAILGGARTPGEVQQEKNRQAMLGQYQQDLELNRRKELADITGVEQRNTAEQQRLARENQANLFNQAQGAVAAQTAGAPQSTIASLFPQAQTVRKELPGMPGMTLPGTTPTLVPPLNTTGLPVAGPAPFELPRGPNLHAVMYPPVTPPERKILGNLYNGYASVQFDQDGKPSVTPLWAGRPQRGANLFTTENEAKDALSDADLSTTHTVTQDSYTGKWRIEPKPRTADNTAALQREQMRATQAEIHSIDLLARDEMQSLRRLRDEGVREGKIEPGKEGWDKINQRIADVRAEADRRKAALKRPAGGKLLTRETATAILDEAGGDPAKARELATARGFLTDEEAIEAVGELSAAEAQTAKELRDQGKSMAEVAGELMRLRRAKSQPQKTSDFTTREGIIEELKRRRDTGDDEAAKALSEAGIE